MSYKVLVVLGGPIKSDNTPDIWLKSRLDETLKIVKILKFKYIILTGGDTKQTGMTEAEIMEKYLLEHGLECSNDQNIIIKEMKARTTFENAQNTCSLLKSTLENISRIYVLTSDFHVPRSRVIFQHYF